MRAAFQQVWGGTKATPPEGYLSSSKPALWRSFAFSLLSAILILVACIVLTKDVNVGEITVDNTITSIEVHSCFLVIDTDMILASEGCTGQVRKS